MQVHIDPRTGEAKINLTATEVSYLDKAVNVLAALKRIAEDEQREEIGKIVESLGKLSATHKKTE